MTAIVFVLALIGAYVNFVTRGWYVMPGVTIYTAAFMATLSVAVLWAVLAKDKRTWTAAFILVANYTTGFIGWHAADPVLSQALFDACTAALFLALATTRWELVLAAIYLVSVCVGALTFFGLIPASGDRPPVFLAISHPDLVSICGHAAAITLGVGSGDLGKRVRGWLSSVPRIVEARQTFVRGALQLVGLAHLSD